MGVGSAEELSQVFHILAIETESQINELILMLCLFTLIIAGSICVDGIISGAHILSIICGVLFVIGLIVSVLSIECAPTITEYKGYFIKETNIVEFNQKYEVVEQNGELYTVRIKEEKENYNG